MPKITLMRPYELSTKRTDGGEVSRLLEEERTKLRTKLDKTASKAQISQPKASPSKKPDAKKLKLGDAVKVVYT